MESSTDAASLAVPMDRLSKFVRQISHDIRNGLNAIDLQATLIAELATDAEIAEEAQKLRGMVSNVTQSLQQVGLYFAPISPNMIEFPAKDLVEAVFERMAKVFPDEVKHIAFKCDLANETAVTDFELLVAMTREIFKNAFQFREKEKAVHFRAYRLGGSMVLEVTESKSEVPSPPEKWGAEPLVSSRRGGLGLGLHHARRIAAAHGGTLEQTFGEEQLTTRVLLPLNSDGQ